MKPLRALPMLSCFLLLASSCAHWEYGVPEQYTEHRLLPLSEYDHSFARSVTESSPIRVAGFSEREDGSKKAAIWVLNGSGGAVQAQALSPQEKLSSEALAINDAGDVAGLLHVDASRSRAVLWQSGKQIDLHDVLKQDQRVSELGVVSSRATAIDKQGRVMGTFTDSNSSERGFLYDDSKIRVFQLLAGKGGGHLNALSGEKNQAVGVSSPQKNLPRSFRLNLGDDFNSSERFELLEAEGLVFSEAHDINRFGHIVGKSMLGEGVASRAFLSVKGRYRDLGVLDGALSSSAYGVNRATKIVGTSMLRSGNARAFVWAPAFEMYDLNKRVAVDSLRTLTHAYDINDQDIIVGDGRFGDRKQAFALVPGKIRVTPIACRAEGPANAKSQSVITYKLNCTNRSNARIEQVLVQSEIPVGSQMVRVSKGGGNQPPSDTFPNGRIRWVVDSLEAGASSDFEFSVVTESRENVVLANFGATVGEIKSDLAVPVFTRLAAPDSRVSIQFLTPTACKQHAENEDIEFELAVNGFTAVKMELSIGGEPIATDKQSPWTFAVEKMPRGIHCIEAVATSSDGTKHRTAPMCLFVGVSDKPTPIYSPVELSKQGGSSSEARAINSGGDVVGWSHDKSGQTHTALWFTRDEDMAGKSAIDPTLIPTTGVCDSERNRRSIGTDINDDGVLVGVCGPVWKQSSFVWRGGRTRSIAIEDKSVRAAALNMQGQVVGRFGASGGANHAFSWSQKDGEEAETRFLFGVSDSPSALAYDINNSGIVVGASLDLQSRAVRWADGIVSELVSSGGVSRANAINNAENPIVVGEMTMNGQTHAFSWTEDAGVLDLHSPKMGRTSRATNVNDFGQIVGSFQADQGPNRKRAFMRTCEQQYDLNQLIPADSGWVLQEALDINSRGQIIGNGLFKGKRRAYVLNP